MAIIKYSKIRYWVRSAFLTALLISGAGQALANLITIAAPGAGPIAPAGAPDSFTLNAASNTFNLVNNVATAVGFQTGFFNINYSNFNGTSWNFAFTELLTINGDTQAVSFAGNLLVTLSVDTLTFYAGPEYSFAGASVYFQPMSISVPGRSAGQTAFTMMADVTPTPEPATLALLGLGLAGLGFIRRKQA